MLDTTVSSYGVARIHHNEDAIDEILEVAVAALLCVDDFNAESGGTYVLHGSHRFEAFPSETFIKRHQVGVDARAGTFLLMDAMLYHRAVANTSPNARRGVNHLVGRPFLGQQIDIPSLLGKRYANDGAVSRYLGYQWRPAPLVAAWRAMR